MQYVKHLLIRLLSLNLIFLILMSVYRFIFFFYYGKGIDFTGYGFDLLKAFYMGVRYDLAVVAYLNTLAVLIFSVLIVIGNVQYFKKFFSFLKYYYMFFIGSLFVLLCVDFGFYSYFQNHLNILLYGFFEDDTLALISTVYENYPLIWISIGFIGIYASIFMISKYILKIKNVKKSMPQNIFLRSLIAVLLISITVITARGSFAIFPLGVDNAEISSNSFVNKVAINGVYTLQAAVEARKKEKRGLDYAAKAGYKNNIRQAFADFLGKDISLIPEENPENSLIVKLPENKEIKALQPNVIFIVMESFGTDLIKYNSTEFNVLGELKKHFDEDFVFYNFLPGHEGTIGSLEAAITNAGRRPLSRYLSQSKHAYEKYSFSGPVPYKNNGYETIFIYGGNTGWRNVGSFFPNLGFEKVLGEGGMKKEYLRNQWGVFDEHLFDYIFDRMSSGEGKKFVYSMTTSNHPPYSLPDDYEALPLNIPEDLAKRIIGRDLADKRFKTYQYSNEMLGRFITRIKESEFAEDTIIAVTGDHNFWNIFAYPTEQLFDSLSVPFYLYIPEKIRPANVDTTVFGSHMDIMPTLYALSLSDAEYMAMGTNLLSEKAKSNIAYTDCGLVVSSLAAVNYNFENKEAGYYTWDKNHSRELVKSDETDEHKRIIRHYLATIAVSDYLIKNTGDK